MKRVYIIIGFIFACLYDLSAQQWGISHVRDSRSIYSIVITGPQNITISGGNDYTDPIEAVFHSTDFGLNWPENPLDTISFCVRSIAFADTMHGFGTGFFGGYVHTTDGGHVWTKDTLPVSRNFFKAIYATPSIAFLAGGEELGSNMQTILKSTDGAANWAIMRDTAGPVLRSVYFIDSLRGTAIGDSGTILRTIDGGSTWIAVAAPVQVNFNSITFINADTGYIVGGSQSNSMQTILLTIDGGATWTILMNQPGPWFADISFLNKDTGYIVGDMATLMQSTDGGQSWARLTVTSANGSESFTSVRFYDRGFGVIGSLNGAGVFVYANPPVPTAKTGNAVFFGNNITLTGSTNTHGSPANLSFIIGSDSLLTSPVETPYPQTITSTSMVPAQYLITGLLGAGTYYFACKVTNTGGSYYGDTATFVIPDSASVLTALPDTNAGITSLTLEGLVSRMPVSSNIYFEYSILGDTLIYTVAATPAITNDTLMHNISAGITGIIPHVQYQYRIKATSGREILYSGYLQFNLSGGNYMIQTFPATNMSADSATLEGQVSDLPLPSTIWFEYLINGATTTVPAVPASVNDTLLHNVSARIGGLTPDSLYQFRVKVLLDSSYPVYGGYYNFYASNALTGNAMIASYPPTNVALNSATLQGGVGGILGTATVWFEYSQNGVITIVPAVPGVISDSLYHPVSAQVSGLIADTLYQYRLKVIVDTSGVIYSGYSAFYTYDMSGLILSADSSNVVSYDSVTLYGHVSNMHFPAQVQFSYWANGQPTVFIPATPAFINDSAAHIVSSVVNGLAPNTAYNYNVVLLDSPVVVQTSNPLQFYTGTVFLTTLPATDLTATSAILNGVIKQMPNSTTHLNFEYGTSLAFGDSVAAAPGTVNDSAQHNVTATVTGLQNNVIYYYRLKGSNATGIVFGDTVQIYTGTSEIPNWDFQYWSYDTVPLLTGWIIYTDQYERVPGQSGNYALKISGQNIVTLGSLDSIGNNGPSFSNGVPYNFRPDSFAAWMNFDLPPGDSAIFIISLHRQGIIVSQPLYTVGGSTGGVFKRFAFKVDNPSGLAPDSLMMAIAVEASTDTVTIDDIQFTPSAAPPIPNGDFETWYNYPYHDLLNWDYLRFISLDSFPPYTGYHTVTQAYFNPPDDYAAQIENVSVGGNYLPCSIGTSEGYVGSQAPSFAVNGRHSTLNGYFKFYPVAGDSMTIQVAMSKNGQWIGSGTFTCGDSVTEFQPFSIPIFYNYGLVPDSSSISIQAYTNGGPYGHSVLIVDKLHFDGLISGINGPDNKNSSDRDGIKIYPNPANSRIYIELTGQAAEATKFDVTDLSGRMVSSYYSYTSGKNFSIDISGLPQGMYVITAKSATQFVSSRFVKY
jgi:photosystem II stability/assembly factor-like uncharacterized protein